MDSKVSNVMRQLLANCDNDTVAGIAFAYAVAQSDPELRRYWIAVIAVAQQKAIAKYRLMLSQLKMTEEDTLAVAEIIQKETGNASSE